MIAAGGDAPLNEAAVSNLKKATKGGDGKVKREAFVAGARKGS